MSDDTSHKGGQTDRDLHLTEEELRASDQSYKDLVARGVLQPLKRREPSARKEEDRPQEPPTFKNT